MNNIKKNLEIQFEELDTNKVRSELFKFGNCNNCNCTNCNCPTNCSGSYCNNCNCTNCNCPNCA